MKKDKKKLKKTLIIITTLLICIGFGLLASSLYLNSNLLLRKQNWNVHFENLIVKDGSVSTTEEEGAKIDADNTSLITYSVAFDKPYDYYEFTVDIKNDGTVDTMVNSIDLRFNGQEIENSSLPSYIDYSVTYVDGVEIESKQLLEAGAKDTIKVRLYFENEITEEEFNSIPQEGISGYFTFQVNYVQDDGTSLDRNIYYTNYSNTLLSNMNNNIDSNTTEGVYFFDDNGNLDYGDNNTKILLNNSINVKGNATVWNDRITYACFNYGNRNYEYDLKTNSIINRDMPCLVNRYDNLVINGDLSYNSNYNLEEFGDYNQDGYISYTSNTRKNMHLTDYIPIDPNKKYEISVDLKSSNQDATYYVGFAEYDVDKKRIYNYNSNYLYNTLTELTKDLKNGDSVIHLKDLTNWVDTTNSWYQRGFIFWNYEDSTGFKYSELTYSRHVFNNINNLYENSNIDKINNKITFNEGLTYQGDTIPVGTKVSQSHDGDNYNYSILNATTINSNWSTYSSGIITGLSRSNNGIFKYGTKFIKFIMLINYNNQPNTTTYIRNLSIREIEE